MDMDMGPTHMNKKRSRTCNRLLGLAPDSRAQQQVTYGTQLASLPQLGAVVLLLVLCLQQVVHGEPLLRDVLLREELLAEGLLQPLDGLEGGPRRLLHEGELLDELEHEEAWWQKAENTQLWGNLRRAAEATARFYAAQAALWGA